MKILDIFNDYYLYSQNLNEANSSKSMMNLFDDPDLTFSDIKKIFIDLFNGKIIVKEKIDGQQLTITYKDGQVLATQNKAMLKNPISIEQIQSKFKCSTEVKNAIINSMHDLEAAIKKLSDDDKILIFSNGKKFLSLTLICPPIKNILNYGSRCVIQLDTITTYDDKWNKLQKDDQLAKTLFDKLEASDALKQKVFEITNQSILKLKGIPKSIDLIITKKLSTLVDGIGWGATINDYAKERFEKYIINRAIASDFPINKKNSFVSELADRLSNISKRRPTKNELSVFAKREGIDIKSESYKNFINELDSTIDDANQVIIKPLEDVIIWAGILLIKCLHGFISADPSKTAKQLSAELDLAIEEFNKNEANYSPADIIKFKKCIAKLEKYQRSILPTEGIIFTYNGKVYKLNCTFSEIKQLMDILKY